MLLSQHGGLGHGGSGSMAHTLSPPLTGRKVCTKILCCFARASPGRALHILLGAMALWKHIGFLPAGRPGDKVLKALFPVISATVPNPYLLGPQTSNSNGSPVCKNLRALISFTSIFAFSKEACCSDPQPYMRSFFTRQPKGQTLCHVGMEVLQNPQITREATISLMLLDVYRFASYQSQLLRQSATF